MHARLNWKNILRSTLGLALLCSLTGCSHKAEELLLATAKQRDEAQTALAKAQDQIKQLQDENTQLKQTPRHYFDQALNEMKAADTANTDAADNSVIAKFRELASRFPEDPLAQASTENIAKLERRISERDAAIQQAQREVLRLIKTCHDSQATVRRINGADGELTTDRFNQLAINWNEVLERQRQQQPYQKAADKAKAKAQSLLTSVPDPDGTLAQKVESCDSPDQDEN